MAGRFPGARDVRTLWGNLCAGIEAVATLSEAELLAAGATPELLANPAHVGAAAVAEGLDRFDAEFFGVGPREAELMDPQLRLALETVWEALEDAGVDPSRERDGIGLFMGAGLSSYLVNNLLPNRDLIERAGAERFLLLNDKDFYPTTISYRLDLRGPSVAVGTACSSSLVAVHLACQSLGAGECRVAIAGGSSVHVPFGRGYLHRTDGIYSPDGRCRVFDARARGTVGADGAAFVVLKRHRDAVRDRDRAHALVLGSAVNNDGHAKAGYTAPSVSGQAAVIRAALERGGVRPSDVRFVEAHGTGTALGDPVEIAALAEAFGSDGDRTAPCLLGSLKANLGHLDTAAGVAGLIKVALAVREGLVPPAVNFETPSPHLNLAGSRFLVNTALAPWPDDGRRRVAGVSAFGVGGTNVHAIVAEAPAAPARGGARGPWILPVSARSDRELGAIVDRLQAELRDERDLADVEFTLARGRKALPVRRAVVTSSARDLVADVAAAAPRRASARPAVWFFAPWRGAASAPLGADLFAALPGFRMAVGRCLDLVADRDVAACVARSFESVACVDARAWSPATRAVRELVFQYALASMLAAWGVTPDRIVGIDVGELVAESLSGAMDLGGVLPRVAAFAEDRPGVRAMLVKLSERHLAGIIPPQVRIAVVCAPEACVIEGPVAVVEPLAAVFLRAGIARKWLADAPAAPATSRTASASPRHERFPAVRLDELMQAAARESALWLELGDGRALRSLLVRNGFDRAFALPALTASRHVAESTRALEWIGALWERGLDVDWQAVLEPRGGRIRSLPSYPFQSRRYWIDAPQPFGRVESALENRATHGAAVPAERTVVADGASARVVVALPKRADLDSWFYEPVWTPWTLPARSGGAPRRRWLVFAGDQPISAALVRSLRDEGHDVVVVREHTLYARLGLREYRIRAGEPLDYDALVTGVLADGDLDAILHAWAVRPPADRPSLEHLDRDQARGIHSLMLLMQALGRANVTTPLRLCIVAGNTQQVVGGDLLHPEHATLKAIGKIVPQEYPNVRAVHVDLDAREPLDASSARRVASVLQAEAGERFLAYREDRWWRADVAPARAPGAPWLGRIVPRGTYLITGGLGGVGLTLARSLAREAQARLVLIGRTALPPREHWPQVERDAGMAGERVRRVQEIEALGSDVLVAAVDLCDRTRMREVLHEAETRFGPIRGVVHAAAVADTAGVVQRRSRRSVDRAMAAKVRGALVLDELLRDRTLDFFVLCSALGATVYNLKFGEIGYVAANDFLSAFGGYLRSSRGVPAITIGWTDWLDVGMTVEALARLGRAREDSEEVDHPVWEWRKESDGTVEYAATIVASAHWVLRGHRIGSCPTLPGTGIIELIAAAFCAEARASGCEIRDLSLLSPVSVEEWRRTRLALTLDARGTGSRCRLTSTDDEGQDVTHATASVAGLSGTDAPPAIALDAIRARCPRSASFAHGQGGVQGTPGLDLDARWDAVRHVWLGDGEGLAQVELAPDFLDELVSFRVHPALVDSAIAFLNHHAADPSFRYLPIGYDLIRIWRPLEPVVHSHGRWKASADRSGETLRFDFDIANSVGDVLVQIAGLTVRRVSASVAQAVPREAVHRLEVGRPGVLSSLGFRRLAAVAPPPGHVEIEVLAAGLNFKDVLTALGLFEQRPFGLECAGRVRRVGAGVTRWRPGDEVIAFGDRWTMPLASVPESWLQSKPEGVGFEEAATVPVAFTIAYHALVHEARLQRGESVLVQSGCGGVGLAAIQIARRLGARIMATAGTEAKRAYLHERGVECVSHSRTAEFVEDARAWTGGRGVDVVLNSLAGDLLECGLDALAPRGRFVELGRRDLAENRPIGLQRLAKGVQFLPVLPDPNDAAFAAAWDAVGRLFADGELTPLPHRTFGAERIADAFEYMSRGEHIGKLVVVPGGAYPRVDAGASRAERGSELAVNALVQGMTPEEGAEAFCRALAAGLPEVLVSTQDLAAMLRQHAIVSDHGHEAFWTPRTRRADASGPIAAPGRRAARHDADVEAGLREIWQDLLGVRDIGPDDDFFDLGGDSLVAVRMIARLKEELDVDQTLAALMEASTFRQMSASIRAASGRPLPV